MVFTAVDEQFPAQCVLPGEIVASIMLKNESAAVTLPTGVAIGMMSVPVSD